MKKLFLLFLLFFTVFSSCLHATLVAEYRFDECSWDGTENEVINSNSASYYGTSYHNAIIVPGHTNNAGKFTDDGTSNSYVRFPSVLENINDESWSITCWIRVLPSSSDWQPFLFIPNNNNDRYGFVSLWYNNANPTIEIWVANGSSVSADLDLSDNQWHFVALTYNGKDLDLYVDNSLVLPATYNHGSLTFSDTKNCYVGVGRNDTKYTSNMLIDEVNIYDTPLTSDELTTIYNNQSDGINHDNTVREVPACNIQALYYLDDCQWDKANNETVYDFGNNKYHGESYDTNLSTGILHTSADFTEDSINDYISLDANALNGLGDLTISTWIKTSKTGSQPLISAANADRGNELLMWLSSSSRFYFYIQNRYRRVDITDIADNQWHMMTWTRSGDKNCLYIDGINKGCTYGLSDAPLTVDPGGLIIGQEQDSVGGSFDKDQNLVGYQDELNIFNIALTPEQVRTLYNRTVAGKEYNNHDRFLLACGSDTACQTPDLQLERTFYDTTGYDTSPSDHTAYTDLITTYATPSRWEGTDLVSAINGSTNPFDSDSDYYLTLFTGYLKIDTEGVYTFAVDGDDAIELLIDNQLITGYYNPHAACKCTTHSREVFLSTGWHKVSFHHQEKTGGDNYYLYWKKPNTADFEIVPSSNLYHCDVTSSLMANYRFDACAWDGSISEVIDYTDNGNNGTAINGLSTDTGKINMAGNFDGNDDYIDMNDTLDPIDTEHWSASVWFRWNGENASQEQDIFSKESVYMTRLKDGKFEYAISPHWYWDGNDSFPVNANEWTHAIITYDGQTQRLYKNGELVFERQQTGAINSNDYPFTVGAWKGTADAGNFFHGNIDELKLFNMTLSPTQIHAIYARELANIAYDGTPRADIDCSMPAPVANYHLDACKYDGTSGEVKDSSGHNNHLTTQNGTQSSADGQVQRAALFDGTDDRINGTWNQTFDKEVTLIAWIKTTDPLGKNYARVVEFSDSSGDYSHSTALAYSSDGTAIRGWTTNTYTNRSASVRYDMSSNGKHDGNWHFIAFSYYHGVSKLYIDGIKVDNAYKNIGTIQSAQTLAIGSYWPNDNYLYHGEIDEVKIFSRALTPAQIQSIYASEQSGKNYDGSLRATVTCAQAIFNAVNQNGGCFNWENNITTQIAGDPIRLTILAADRDTNTTLTDANITKLELLSFSDPICTTLYSVEEIWNGNSAVDSSGCWNPANIIHNKAIRCAKIRITGIFEGNSVESNSTDTFAIRPKSYILQNIPTGKLTAEHLYTFKAVAVNSDGTTQTPDYNTTVTPQANKYFRDGSDGSAMAGVFTPTADFVFTDGVTADTSLSFDNVGIIGLELNDTSWAITDADDTPLAERTIYLEQNLTFIPAKFQITFPTAPVMRNYNDGTFTYYANDLTNMHASLRNLSFTVTALGENNAVMTNYQNPQTTYFANNSDFSLGLAVEHNPNLSADINESSTKDLNFSAGVATINYNDIAFNFTREHNVTLEPLVMQGANSQIEINVTDSIDTTVSGHKTETFSDSATFYYGRIVTDDLRTADTPVPHKVSFAVYSTNPLSGFDQYTQNWYINKLDSFSSWQSIIPKINRSLSSNIQNSASISNEAGTLAGVKTFDLVANPANQAFKAFFHLDIPAWLWYSRYESYDFGATSSCATHPCFAYIFDYDDQGVGIGSGDFKGASFDHNITATPKRKAVKLLR